MVPVLLGFKKASSVLDPALSKHVARKLCASSLTAGEMAIPQLATRLRAKGLGGFAKLVEQTCTAMSRGEDERRAICSTPTPTRRGGSGTRAG